MPFNLPQRPEGADTEYTRFVGICDLHPEWPQEMRNWNFYNAFVFAFKYNYIIAHNSEETKQLCKIIDSIFSGNTFIYIENESIRKRWVKLLCNGQFVEGYDYADQHEAEGVGNFIRDLKNCIEKTVRTRSSRSSES